MSDFDGSRLADATVQAVERLGIRAVVQSGWAGLDVRGDDILTIGSCPHRWLFPRMRAAVHHAGAGTAHACLEAGTPALPVPTALDQPFWSSRFKALGLTPASLPMRRLSADNLTNALQKLLKDDSYRRETRRFSSALQQQDGIAAFVGEIERLAAP